MEPQLQTDHDTLIKIETKLDLLTGEVKRGNDDTKERLTLLGANKVEKEEFHQWQITHEKETTLREDVLKRAIADSSAVSLAAIGEHSDQIKSLVNASEKQSKQIQYVAGGLFVLGVILSILGPVISSGIAKLFHLN